MTTHNEHTERAELTDAQIDEIAEQHATGQDDQDRYIVTTAELHEIIKDAAAMLEAQRPALKPLTDGEKRGLFTAAYEKRLVHYESYLQGIEDGEAAHGIKEQA